MAGIVFSKLSGLNDSVFGKSAEPIRMLLEKRAEAFEESSLVKKLFAKERSKSFGEKTVSMTAMEGFQPTGEGGAYPDDELQEGFSKFIEHVTWKDKFTITREMIEDAKLMDLRKKPAAFITGYHRTCEMFGAAMLAGGTGATITFRGMPFDTTAQDGMPLFCKEHKSKVNAKFNQSNLFANEFSADALGLAETAMQNLTDDNANPLAMAPDTIVIANSAAMKKAVFEAIGADKDPDTSNNGFNYQYGRWNVIINPYFNGLIGEKAWMLMDSAYNRDVSGNVWYERTPLEVTPWVDHNNDNAVWNGRARFGVGFNDWRQIAMGGMTGGTELV